MPKLYDTNLPEHMRKHPKPSAVGSAPTGSPAARPTMVKVLNFDFEVKWVDKDTENGAQKFGWCNCNDQIIGISNGLKPTKTADTFIHEVFHALNWVMDIKDGVKEEEICTRLSSAICCFWRDNPAAFLWWSKLIRGNCDSQTEK